MSAERNERNERNEGGGRFMVGVLAAGCLFIGTGCAGARTTIAADHAAYPVSLSPAVRDSDKKIVSGDDLEHVAKFRADATAWGMPYSAIRLNPRTDISAQINDQIRRAGGEAIVNLKIMSAQCGANFAALIDAIPLWPGCAKIAVEGDIVKVKRGQAAAQPTKVASAESRASASVPDPGY
jgi:hypothetical protein